MANKALNATGQVNINMDTLYQAGLDQSPGDNQSKTLLNICLSQTYTYGFVFFFFFFTSRFCRCFQCVTGEFSLSRQKSGNVWNLLTHRITWHFTLQWWGSVFAQSSFSSCSSASAVQSIGHCLTQHTEEQQWSSRLWMDVVQFLSDTFTALFSIIIISQNHCLHNNYECRPPTEVHFPCQTTG